MYAYDKNYINQLKAKIVTEYNATEIESSDCYQLSIEIEKNVGKRVSETTLKRFFGFTSCKHTPSNYTLNALAGYCGFSTWNEFKQKKIQESSAHGIEPLWFQITDSITKSTSFYISTIKRRNLDWDHRVARNWIDKMFRDFSKSSSNLLLFHGPAGYGKTLGVADWIERQRNQTFQHTPEMVLFLESVSLFQSAVYGFHPDKWLASVLDITDIQQLESFLNNKKEQASGSLHIIVDGLNEEYLAETQYYTVLQNLMELAAYFKDHQQLKFTLIMRSNIYYKFVSRLNHGYRELLHNHSSSKSNNNIDPWLKSMQFSVIELSTLMDRHNMEHTLDELVSSGSHEWLRIPSMFGFYRNLKATNPNLDFRTPELGYILLLKWFEQFPYLIDQLIQLGKNEFYELILRTPTVLSKSQEFASTARSRRIFRTHETLVDQLVGQGIFVKKTDPTEPEYIFSRVEYKSFIYAYYLFNNAEEIDETTNIGDQLIRTTRIFHLLIWMQEFKRSETSRDIDWGNHLGLSKEDTLYFSVVFGHFFYQSGNSTEKDQLRNFVQNPEMIRMVLHDSLLDYEQRNRTVEMILKMDPERHAEYQLRFKLAIISLLKWDEESFIQQLEHLVRIRTPEEDMTSLNPIAGLSTLYHHFKLGKRQITDVQRVFNLNYDRSWSNIAENYFTYEVIGYMLMMICPEKTIVKLFLKNLRVKLLRLPSSDQVSREIIKSLIEIAQAMREMPALAQELKADFVVVHKSPLEKITEEVGKLTHPSHPQMNLLNVFRQILTFHLEIMSESGSDRINAKITHLRRLIRPMGFELINLYFEKLIRATHAAQSKTPK